MECGWCCHHLLVVLVVFLLFSSHVHIGAAIALKKLVIGEFLLVLIPICFLVCCGQLLGLLWVFGCWCACCC